MSDYRLNTFVHAVEVDSKGARTGREGTFGPDDDLSTSDNEWALAAITNKDVWVDGRAPEREAPEPVEDPEVTALKARIAELEQAQAAAGSASGSKVPPRQGPGSGGDKWREYAAAQQVEVAADASRDDVIAALDKAGKPTR
jgi:hypothetical protein